MIEKIFFPNLNIMWNTDIGKIIIIFSFVGGLILFWYYFMKTGVERI